MVPKCEYDLNTSVEYQESGANTTINTQSTTDESCESAENGSYQQNYSNEAQLQQQQSTTESLNIVLPSTSTASNDVQTTIKSPKKTKKRSGNQFREFSQKDFNRKMKACIQQVIPIDDQKLGIMDLCEKYPEKLNEIKSMLF